MNNEADYAARVILHRAPEVADAVMPVEVFAGVVEVIDLLSERLAVLSEALDGPQIKSGGKTSERPREAVCAPLCSRRPAARASAS
jgi:hypothetical protein